MRKFLDAVAAGAGGVIGVALALGIVGYAGGRLAESRFKAGFADLERRFRERTDELLTPPPCQDDWHNWDPAWPRPEGTPKKCPTCGLDSHPVSST